MRQQNNFVQYLTEGAYWGSVDFLFVMFCNVYET